MKEKEKSGNKSYKNFRIAVGFSKLLQPTLHVLFYVSIFVIVLSIILAVIIFFVNVDTEQMLLPPFMGKILDNTGHVVQYDISFGNGIKIITDADNVALSDIKSVIYAGIFVIICTLLTIAPVFRFMSMLLKNINSGEFDKITDERNPRYIMYIGLCISVGTILIRFMMRFYNYYLAVRFIHTMSSQEIKLSLGVDVLSGITGLVILFIGMILAYVFQRVRNNKF